MPVEKTDLYKEIKNSENIFELTLKVYFSAF